MSFDTTWVAAALVGVPAFVLLDKLSASLVTVAAITASQIALGFYYSPEWNEVPKVPRPRHSPRCNRQHCSRKHCGRDHHRPRWLPKGLRERVQRDMDRNDLNSLEESIQRLSAVPGPRDLGILGILHEEDVPRFINHARAALRDSIYKSLVSTHTYIPWMTYQTRKVEGADDAARAAVDSADPDTVLNELERRFEVAERDRNLRRERKVRRRAHRNSRIIWKQIHITAWRYLLTEDTMAARKNREMVEQQKRGGRPVLKPKTRRRNQRPAPFHQAQDDVD